MSDDANNDAALDAKFEAFVHSLGGTAEALTAEAPPAEEAPPGEVTTAAGETEETASGETEETTEDYGEDEDQYSRGWERLTAREAELRERENALKAKEASITSEEALVKAFVQDPAHFLEKYGQKNFDVFAKMLWNAHLGEDAPPELKQEATMAQIQRKIREQEEEYKRALEEVKEKNRTVTLQVQVDMLDRDLLKATKKVSAEQYPYLAIDTEEDVSTVYDAAVALAAEYIKDAPDRPDEWPTATEILEELENELAKQVKRYAKFLKDEGGTPPEKTQRQMSTTLSSTENNQRPNVSGDDPRKNWSEEQWEQAGIATLLKHSKRG